MTDGELRMLNNAIDEINKRHPAAAQFIIEKLKRAGGFLDDRCNKNPHEDQTERSNYIRVKEKTMKETDIAMDDLLKEYYRIQAENAELKRQLDQANKKNEWIKDRIEFVTKTLTLISK